MNSDSATTTPTGYVHSPSTSSGGHDVTPANAAARWVTWLHLSDLHCQLDDEYNRSEVLQALWQDLNNRTAVDPALAQVDFVVFTGDIAYHGTLAEYDLAVEKFFKPLLDCVHLDWTRLFVVPGNHDVCRNDMTPLSKRSVSTLLKRDDVTRLLEISDEDHHLVFKRQQAYRAFFEKNFNHLSLDSRGYFYVAQLSLQSSKLALIGLNSAWSGEGGKADRGNLLLGERQIAAALENVKEADLHIALLHHPMYWLQDDHEDTPGAIRRLEQHCDLILSGHLHHPDVCSMSTLTGDFIRVPAGAIYDNRLSPLGYNFVRFDLATKSGMVYLRRYNDGRGEWQRDTFSTGDKDNGRKKIALSATPIEPVMPRQAGSPRTIASDAIHLVQTHLNQDNYDTLARMLAVLSGDPRYIGELEHQLNATSLGCNLWRAPEFALPLRELAKSIDAPSEIKNLANRLLLQRRKPVRWITWPNANRATTDHAIDRWLESADFAFNPFGPLRAEGDPLLPTFAVEAFDKKTRGASTVLGWGVTGAGKTGAALLLEHDCNEPPENPRISGTFPVYNSLQLNIEVLRNLTDCLKYLAAITADKLIQYLAMVPSGFLELQSISRQKLGELLLRHTGSQENLARRLRAVPNASIDDRLLSALGNLGAGVRQEQLDDEAWLDLLGNALPAEFKQMYLLIDIAGLPLNHLAEPPVDLYSFYATGLRLLEPELRYDRSRYSDLLVYQQRLLDDLTQARRYGDTNELSSDRSKIIDYLNNLTFAVTGISFRDWCDQKSGELRAAAQLQVLWDLSERLADKNIYLKVFAPDVFKIHLSHMHNPAAVALQWSKKDLQIVLAQRLRQASRNGSAAGRERLEDLCDPSARGMDIDKQLTAAVSTPRELVQWGNRLLEIHTKAKPNVPLLDDETVRTWQIELANKTRLNKEPRS